MKSIAPKIPNQQTLIMSEFELYDQDDVTFAQLQSRRITDRELKCQIKELTDRIVEKRAKINKYTSIVHADEMAMASLELEQSRRVMARESAKQAVKKAGTGNSHMSRAAKPKAEPKIKVTLLEPKPKKERKAKKAKAEPKGTGFSASNALALQITKAAEEIVVEDDHEFSPDREEAL